MCIDVLDWKDYQADPDELRNEMLEFAELLAPQPVSHDCTTFYAFELSATRMKALYEHSTAGRLGTASCGDQPEVLYVYPDLFALAKWRRQEMEIDELADAAIASDQDDESPEYSKTRPSDATSLGTRVRLFDKNTLPKEYRENQEAEGKPITRHFLKDHEDLCMSVHNINKAIADRKLTDFVMFRTGTTGPPAQAFSFKEVAAIKFDP